MGSFKTFLSVILVLPVVFLVACAAGSSDNSSAIAASSPISDSDSEESGAAFTTGSASALVFDGDGRAPLDLDGLDDSDEITLVLYNYDVNGNQEAYQLSADSSPDVHAQLRMNEDELELTDKPMYRPAWRSHLKYAAKPALGDRRDFKVLSSLTQVSDYQVVTAELIYTSDDFLAYVDTEDLDAVDHERLEVILDRFSDVVADERELFGEESDVDGDSVFHILFTRQVNALGSLSGGFTSGYFYAVDLFPSSTYAQSNEKEVIYISLPDPTGEDGTPISEDYAYNDVIPSALPHEFQHMINFNQHYWAGKGSTEKSFLNEGLSHLAEDVYSINANGFMEQTGTQNRARVQGYLRHADSLCMICGTSLYQRGGIYLFLRYFYEQAEAGALGPLSSGADFVESLLVSGQTGVDNLITSAAGDTGNPEAYQGLISRFSLAVVMDGLGLNESDADRISGFDLAIGGADVDFPFANDVETPDLTSALQSSGFSVHRLSVSALRQAAISSLRKDSSAKIGGYLIRH